MKTAKLSFIMLIVSVFLSASPALAFTLAVNVSPSGSGLIGSTPGTIYCESCSEEFSSGQEVTLYAYPNTGYQFDHWENLDGTTAEPIILMDSDKTVTAVFKESSNPQTLTVNVSPEGAGYADSWPDGIDCENFSAEFPQRAEVILTACFMTGYEFDHWEGDLTGEEDSQTVLMDSAKTVTAVFKESSNPQTLTVNVYPEGAGYADSWPDGIDRENFSAEFPQGAEVILTACFNEGYEFDHWEGDLSGTKNEETLVMESAKTVTAVFKESSNPQKLTVKVEPSGAGGLTSWPEGICCPDGLCEWEFPQGTEVILTAYFMTGYEFDHWEGDLEGREISKPVTMDSAKTVTAVFKESSNPQKLTVKVEPSGAGTANSWPEGISCPDGACEWEFPFGTEVELKATVNAGFRFDHWEGDLSGTGSSQKLSMTGSKSVTAVFVPSEKTEKLTVTVSPSGSGAVISEPSGISCPEQCLWDFVHGETVFLTAIPKDGFVFDYWQGSMTGKEDAASLLMDASKTVTAVFAEGMEFPEELTPVGTELQDLGAISFTYFPVNPDSRSIFGNDVAQNYGKDYRMGTYDPLKGDYNEYGPNLKIEPGRGLWFLSRNPCTIKIKGSRVSLSEDFDLPLLYNPATGDGWNMIACPNDGWYDWNEMEVLADGQKFRISDPGSENCISLRFWKWVEGNYVFYDAEGPGGNEKYPFDPDPVLKPFKGYWVKVRKANVTLRFPVSAQVDKEAEMKFRSFAGTRRSSSSGENPPTPISGFDQKSAASEDSVGGCFLSTLLKN